MRNRKSNDRKIYSDLIIFAIIFFVLFGAAFYAHKKGWIALAEKYFPPKFSLEQEEAEKVDQEKDVLGEKEVYATSHKTESKQDADFQLNFEKVEEIQEIQQPLTQEPLSLKDIYTEEREEIILKVFYPNAVEYKWEAYDIESKAWLPVEQTNTVKDELYRQISVCKVSAIQGVPNMIRCITTTDIETHTDTSNIYVLEKAIVGIRVEDYEAEAGCYLNARDIPVNVQYDDGSEESVTGLYGLYFLEEEINKSSEESLSGNMIETTTTILTEKEYILLGNEEREVTMRYRMNDSKDDDLVITGRDEKAPEIINVECSGYEVSNIDRPVVINVSVQAEDNETPYPYLQYAFLPEETEIQESDWKSNPQFEVEIHKNGNWVTYCRDQSGNVTTVVQELIVVDQKAPDMDVKLKNADWCVNTRIMVEAQDTLEVKYHYSCPEKEIESGWTEENQYLIEDNGTWIIKVQDAVGNISEQEIRIENIDKEVPVIHGIVEG